MGAEATLKLLLLGEDRSAGKALRGAGRDADSTRGKFGKLAKVGSVALAGGLLAAGAAAVKFGRAAAADQASAAMLEKSLKNTTGATDAQVKATEDWITAQGKALGVADDNLRPALASLARATGDVGEAQELAGLAMDISAGTGKDLGAVATALAKAQNGQVGGLGRLGIATKDAEGKTKTFSAIQDDLAKKFGGSAATAADTFEGKMGRLNLMFEEGQEAIGAKLLPVAEDLVDWFVRDGLPAIQKFGKWFKENLLPPIKELAEKIMVGARKAFEQFKKAISDARPGLELYGNVIKNVIWPIVKKLAEVALPALGLAFRAIGKYMGFIGKAGTDMWNNVLQPVFKFFAQAVGVVLRGLAKMFAALGKVPGMGWAKNAAEDLNNAADGAYDLADGIRKIPPKKDIRFNITGLGTLSTLQQSMNLLSGASAVGGPVNTSGFRLVGEHGPEIAYIPAGSQVYSATQTDRMRVGATGDGRTVVIENHFGVGTDRRAAAREIVGMLKELGVTTGAPVTV